MNRDFINRDFLCKNNKYIVWIEYSVIFIFFLLLFSFSRKCIGTDDVNFSNQIKVLGYFPWLAGRYFGWSGRVFSDAVTGIFLFVPIPVWAAFNSFLFCLLIFSLTEIVFGSHSINKDTIVLSVFFYIPLGIFVDSASWIVGSFNYLWVTSLGVYSLAYLKNEYLGKISKRRIIYLIFAFFACLGTEQLALVLACLSFISIITFYIRKESINLNLISYFVSCFVPLIISVLSPGDSRRRVLDSHRWYKNFLSESITEKIKIGFNWEISNLFKLVLPLSLALLIIFIYEAFRKESIKKIDFSINLAIFFLIFLTNNLLKIKNIDFNNYFQYPLNNHHLIFLLILYGLFFFAVLNRTANNKKIVMLTFLASILSAALLYFSPTIFASGARTYWISWICLVFIFVQVLSDIKLVNARSLFLLSIYPLSNLMLYAYWLISQGFVPHTLW
ncbi:DUF6056 family protein [Oenococcus oeni]|uniref:DUF6056 family protein n=1 Tax=Oenococcus oeni TaxID=1247 RepID=UPI000AEF9F1A|nr:DUF6056 family protein [Oenococcus oeni]